MKLTLVPSLQASLKNTSEIELDWKEVGEFLELRHDPAHAKKEDLELIFPGVYKKGATKKGEDSVQEVHLGILDFDDVTDLEFAAVKKQVEGFAHCIYTTYSNRKHRQEKGHWKFRLVMPLSRPVLPEEWPAVWSTLNRLFGTVEDKTLADPQCKNINRLYFISEVSYPPNAKGEFEHDFYSFEEGESLDADVLLVEGKTVQSQAEVTAPTGVAGFYIDQLTPLAKHLAKSDSGVHAQLASWVKKLIKGIPLPFAVGERHLAYTGLCKAIGDWFPNIDPNAIYRAALSRSVEQLNLVSPDHPIAEQEIIALLSGAQAKRREEIAARKEEQDKEYLESCWHAGSEPYTQEEVEEWAGNMGMTVEQLRRHLVVQVGEAYWVFFRGRYLDYGKSDAQNALQECLRPAVRVLNLRMRKMSRDETVDKTPTDLVREYGVSKMKIRFEAGRHYYEFDKVKNRFLVPLFTRTDWKPERSEFVGGWLECVCADEPEKLEDLEKWIGWSVDLKKPLSLFFFSGEHGSGKTLISQALASIWGTDFVETDQAFTKFNDELRTSPIILADEGFPPDQTRRIRSFLGRNKHKVEQKFRDVATIEANFRFVVTANNEQTFYNLKREVLGLFDLEALAIRTFHVHAAEASREYLSAAGEERIEEMLKSGEFAQHAAYLAEKYKDAPRARFGTKADRNMVRKITMSSGVPSTLMRWVIGYLLSDKSEKKKQSVAKIRVQDGKLLVTMRAFEDWDVYLNEPKPTYDAIFQAFGTITTSKIQKRRVPGEVRAQDRRDVEFSVISTEHLEAWLDANPSYVSYYQVMDALKIDTPIDWHKPVGA